jgi:hypothetical protein
MSPLTATYFVALWIALVFLHFAEKRPLGAGPHHPCDGGLAARQVGYFFSVARLCQSGNFTAVALHTAIAFVALCICVSCATSGPALWR